MSSVKLNSKFDETQWIEHIRQTLDEELMENTEIRPYTIFGVPKALMLTDPDSYIPQEVAIGPYHHLRPELHDMERHKVAAAKRNQMEYFQNVKFQDLVNHLTKFEPMIRSKYYRPLSYGREALSWMMAMDASFLFEFLQICGVNQGKVVTENQQRLAHLINLSRYTTANNTILRDIIMLENQIPLCVVRMLLEFHFSSLDLGDKMLLDMLVGLGEELFPFIKVVNSHHKVAVNDCAHLLDFLYKSIVPKRDHVSLEIHVEEGEDHQKHHEEKNDSFEKPMGRLKLLLHVVKYPVKWMLERIIFSKTVEFICNLAWTICLSRIPVINVFKDPIEHTVSVSNGDEEKKDDEESNSNSNKPPLQEEIDIPSVTQLVEAGVKFVPISGGISSVSFNKKTLRFYMPTIKLDANSAVVLRNLVAYEACTASGPLYLTRYTELMNGIIDTDADAKFLRRSGIIINHLKSDKEVADLWNGMSRSIRLTKVPSLDRVIADVNMYYDRKSTFKFKKFMKEYGWRILTFLAAIAVLSLMFLQAFCQVYSCSRIVRIKSLSP